MIQPHTSRFVVNLYKCATAMLILLAMLCACKPPDVSRLDAWRKRDMYSTSTLIRVHKHAMPRDRGRLS